MIDELLNSNNNDSNNWTILSKKSEKELENIDNLIATLI
jgi:hypothetical protein